MPGVTLTSIPQFPDVNTYQRTEEKVETILSHLFALHESLRYILYNLGDDNINTRDISGLTEVITTPVYISLSELDGRFSALSFSVDGLGIRVGNAEGYIAQLTLTAYGLTTRVSDAEGNISTLQQTSTSLMTRVSNVEGSYSQLTQTVYGMTLEVSNGTNNSWISLTAGGITLSSRNITFSGMVTFTDLSTPGATFINGGNITTGTIAAIDIYGCTITGSLFQCMLNGDSSISGDIRMYYMSNMYWAGGMRLDDQGGIGENKWRMFLYTNNTYGIPFAMKMQSAAGISLQAAGGIYLTAGAEGIKIGGPGQNVYLEGTIYKNGVQI